MNAQVALRGSPLHVASRRAQLLMQRGAPVRSRVSFVRAISLGAIAAPGAQQTRLFLTVAGWRAGSLASLRWNPSSIADSEIAMVP